MKMNRIAPSLLTAGLPLLVLAVVLLSRARWVEAVETEKNTDAKTGEVVLASEINWTPLNPARGDASPQAGTLWGNRAGSPQTGFLVKFADGFSSPPHIHNVTYRGVVLSGQIHNDDPEAEEMWMPTGSFWTQPAGEVHITAAKGEENIAFIEIDRGPYLVWPPEQASDNGERPVNVHASNLTWLDTTATQWITTDGPEVAFLWGEPEAGKSNGSLLKLPAGFSGVIRSDDSELKAVVIEGALQLQIDGSAESKTLGPGSYFRSEETASHRIQSAHENSTLLYLRSKGTYTVE